MVLEESEKTGAIFWLMVSWPEMAPFWAKRGQKVKMLISHEPLVVENDRSNHFPNGVSYNGSP